MSNKKDKGASLEVENATAEKERVEAFQKKEKEVAEQIQKVLEASNMALQPFLNYSEYGVVPRVRLVENELQDNQSQDDGQEADTTEVGGDSNEHESTDTESA